MRYIVYSTEDSISSGIAEHLRLMGKFDKSGEILGYAHLYSKELDMHMLQLDKSLLYAEELDNLKAEVLVILSRHSSANSIKSFTVHPTGNWSDEAKLGGMPKELSTAAPLYMLSILKAMSILNKENEIDVTYEATHHGPLLKTPMLFAEIENNTYNEERARIVAQSVIEGVKNAKNMKNAKVAIGIGSTHYPKKFTQLALSGRFAFGHMLPKYYVENIDMLEKAVNCSQPKAEIAAIDWKSLNVKQRAMVIEKLEELGIEYERV
ncbi:MAG: D-aminoacyl-tRNA deacylase [Candidatus Micrarchaeia archaeon]